MRFRILTVLLTCVPIALLVLLLVERSKHREKVQQMETEMVKRDNLIATLHALQGHMPNVESLSDDDPVRYATHLAMRQELFRGLLAKQREVVSELRQMKFAREP